MQQKVSKKLRLRIEEMHIVCYYSYVNETDEEVMMFARNNI